MKLYELSAIYAHVQAELEEGDPASADQALAKIDALEGAFNDKATQIAFVIKNMQAMADAVGGEVDRMTDRKKAMDSHIARVKEYLRSNMERAAVKRIECPQFRITLHDNPPKVTVIDEKAIPAEYMKVPEPPAPYPDKKAIVDDWKQGVVIDGVDITIGNRVEIR